MKTAWEVQRGEQCFYINLGTEWVEVGSHRGSGATDNGGRCTHAEFLAGRWLENVRDDLGPEVLAEVMASIKAMAAAAAKL